MIIKKIILSIIRFFSKLLYKILPATLCSKIAMSKPAAWLSRLVSSKNIATYSLKHGIRLNLTREEALSGYLQLGELNPIETKIIKNNLKQGQVFFDVGAYIDGWYSILASKIVGTSGQVFSFEPIPKFFSRLEDNINLNECKNVNLEKYAFTNVCEKQKFTISGQESGLKENTTSDDKETVVVDTITIDKYMELKNIKTVDFIKIDVEGIEPRVIEGAEKTLKKHRPLLLIEVVDSNLQQFNTSAEALIKYICSLGYQAFVIRTHGPKPYNEKNQTSTTPNMFFKPIQE